MHSELLHRQQHLLIDADDTLWENNIYFERAFEDFVDFLDHQHLSGAEIQAVLDEIELANRGLHGYGARAYARSLRDSYRQITGVAEDDPNLATAEQLGLRILEQACEAIDGVEETIAALRPHHDLYLFTKGHDDEQRRKVERSGLVGFFDAVLIANEKDQDAYREVVATLELDASQAWMIGNSPRSDINPALRAGLNAVWIPHPRTWHLEVEEIVRDSRAPGQLLQLTTFRELLTVFEATTAD
jgi:putative hydrolase of the HAD superfamily